RFFHRRQRATPSIAHVQRHLAGVYKARLSWRPARTVDQHVQDHLVCTSNVCVCQLIRHAIISCKYSKPPELLPSTSGTVDTFTLSLGDNPNLPSSEPRTRKPSSVSFPLHRRATRMATISNAMRSAHVATPPGSCEATSQARAVSSSRRAGGEPKAP